MRMMWSLGKPLLLSLKSDSLRTLERGVEKKEKTLLRHEDRKVSRMGVLAGGGGHLRMRGPDGGDDG